MSEAKAGGAVSTYTVIGNVDSNGKAQSLATTPLSVDSSAATRTPKGYQQRTVSNTSVGFTSVPSGSKYALVQVTTAVRYRDDGTDPTASVGYPLWPGVEYRIDVTDLTAAKFIRQTTSDATMDVEFYA